MKQLFSLLLLLMLLTGCVKNTNEIVYDRDLIFNEMDTLCFKQGTFWVYELENSQQLDCVFVKTVIKSFYNVDFIDNSGVIREYYEMTMGNSANEKLVYWIESSRMVYNPTKTIPYAIGLFLYSAKPSVDWKFTDNKSFDSIVSGFHVYHQVQRCRNSEVTLFTNRDLGVVMKQVTSATDTLTWRLIRWNLIR